MRPCPAKKNFKQFFTNAKFANLIKGDGKDRVKNAIDKHDEPLRTCEASRLRALAEKGHCLRAQDRTLCGTEWMIHNHELYQEGKLIINIHLKFLVTVSDNIF